MRLPASGIGYFVQSAEAQAAPRQMAVHHVDTERQNGVRGLRAGVAFQPGDLRPYMFNVLKRLSHVQVVDPENGNIP
jgi:hypothetical protein